MKNNGKLSNSFNRCLPLPASSFVLFGPRGTGKTRWLRDTLPHAHFIDLLSEAAYHDYLAYPGRFAEELSSLKRGTWVVVDEIQRLPNLLNEVHRLIEMRGLRFALCGSSTRKLKQAGVNLLAGRLLRSAMHPFIPSELGAKFDLASALRFGLLPLVFSAKNKSETLAAYVRAYLAEEIKAEALVRNLAGFARFLPIVALFHGQVMNISNIAAEAGVSRSTVQGFIEILQDTLLCEPLPAYEAKLRVRERKHPKWYFADPGIVRALKNQLGPVAIEERGPLFEGMVFQTLRAYRDYRRIFDEMFYYASHSGKSFEVDFILRKGKRWIALEVKAGERWRPESLRGLSLLKQEMKIHKAYCIVPEGNSRLLANGIEVISFARFAEGLEKNSLF